MPHVHDGGGDVGSELLLEGVFHFRGHDEMNVRDRVAAYELRRARGDFFDERFQSRRVVDVRVRAGDA